ncbi:MAG: DUF6675 family protein [Spirochaetia bacterium]
MMQTARAIIPVAALLLTTVSLAAWDPVSTDSLYPDGIDLDTGETITRTADSIADTRLMPETNGLREAIENNLEEISERIIVESARLVAVPPGAEPDSDSQEQLTVANILRNIESMEGIEYYSERRDRMRTLFAKSSRISGPEDTEPVPYEPVTTIPDSETVHALQEDLTFGENIYRFQYERLSNAQLLSIENLERLTYGILPAIGRENLRMFVVAIPVEQGLLFYGAAAVQVPTLMGLGNRIATSFENRVNALAQWFEDMLENA